MENPIGYDLLIRDDDILNTGKAAQKRAGKLDSIMDEYISLLKKVVDEAILAGNAKVNLERLLAQIELLKGDAKDLGNTLNQYAGNFIRDFDEADKEFYE
jgi:hypothetical protein